MSWLSRNDRQHEVVRRRTRDGADEGLERARRERPEPERSRAGPACRRKSRQPSSRPANVRWSAGVSTISPRVTLSGRAARVAARNTLQNACDGPCA